MRATLRSESCRVSISPPHALLMKQSLELLILQVAILLRSVHFLSHGLCRGFWIRTMRRASRGRRRAFQVSITESRSRRWRRWRRLRGVWTCGTPRRRARDSGASSDLKFLLTCILATTKSDRTLFELQEMVVEFKDAGAKNERGSPEFVPGLGHWEGTHFDRRISGIGEVWVGSRFVIQTVRV